MEKFILVREGGDAGRLETCCPHCVQGLVPISWSARGFTSVFSLCPCSDDDDAGSLDILMEAPEGFRNSDEECFSESQVNQNENLKPVAELVVSSAVPSWLFNRNPAWRTFRTWWRSKCPITWRSAARTRERDDLVRDDRTHVQLCLSHFHKNTCV